MNKRKLVLSHKGVKIYHSWKGAQALTFWYALVPNHNAEGDGQDFDVRCLPLAYRQGLDIEITEMPADAGASLRKYDRMLEAHKAAMRRAIDDGHDFLIARRPLHVRLWQRLRKGLGPAAGRPQG